MPSSRPTTSSRAREVELIFVAANNSPDVDDKLVSITSDVGTVTLTGDTTVPASGVLVVGAPDGQTTPLESVEAAEAVEATVKLSKPITNGITYDFTFDFERAGRAPFRCRFRRESPLDVKRP